MTRSTRTARSTSQSATPSLPINVPTSPLSEAVVTQRYNTRRSTGLSQHDSSPVRRTYSQVVTAGPTPRMDSPPVPASQAVPVSDSLPTDLPFEIVTARRTQKSVRLASRRNGFSTQISEVLSPSFLDDDVSQSDSDTDHVRFHNDPEVTLVSALPQSSSTNHTTRQSPPKRKRSSSPTRHSRPHSRPIAQSDSDLQAYLSTLDLHMGPSLDDGRCLFSVVLIIYMELWIMYIEVVQVVCTVVARGCRRALL